MMGFLIIFLLFLSLSFCFWFDYVAVGIKARFVCMATLHQWLLGT